MAMWRSLFGAKANGGESQSPVVDNPCCGIRKPGGGSARLSPSAPAPHPSGDKPVADHDQGPLSPSSWAAGSPLASPNASYWSFAGVADPTPPSSARVEDATDNVPERKPIEIFQSTPRAAEVESFEDKVYKQEQRKHHEQNFDDDEDSDKERFEKSANTLLGQQKRLKSSDMKNPETQKYVLQAAKEGQQVLERIAQDFKSQGDQSAGGRPQSFGKATRDTVVGGMPGLAARPDSDEITHAITSADLDGTQEYDPVTGQQTLVLPGATALNQPTSPVAHMDEEDDEEDGKKNEGDELVIKREYDKRFHMYPDGKPRDRVQELRRRLQDIGDDEPIDDGPKYEAKKKLKQFSLEALFSCEVDGKKAMDKNVTFVKRPLGVLWDKKAPIRIAEVRRDSQADDLGIKVGYILKAVNGHDITSYRYQEMVEIFMTAVERLPTAEEYVPPEEEKEEEHIDAVTGKDMKFDDWRKVQGQPLWSEAVAGSPDYDAAFTEWEKLPVAKAQKHGLIGISPELKGMVLTVRVRVTIEKAIGFSDYNAFHFVICQIPGKPHSKVTTEPRSVNETPDSDYLEWHRTYDLFDYERGDLIEFAIYARDQAASATGEDTSLGRARLSWEMISAHGFDGELTLMDPRTNPPTPTKTKMNVRVMVDAVPEKQQGIADYRRIMRSKLQSVYAERKEDNLEKLRRLEDGFKTEEGQFKTASDAVRASLREYHEHSETLGIFMPFPGRKARNFVEIETEDAKKLQMYKRHLNEDLFDREGWWPAPATDQGTKFGWGKGYQHDDALAAHYEDHKRRYECGLCTKQQFEECSFCRQFEHLPPVGIQADEHADEHASLQFHHEGSVDAMGRRASKDSDGSGGPTAQFSLGVDNATQSHSARQERRGGLKKDSSSPSPAPTRGGNDAPQKKSLAGRMKSNLFGSRSAKPEPAEPEDQLESVIITFEDDDDKEQQIEFENRPLGIEFYHYMPLKIRSFKRGNWETSLAQDHGVKEGWKIVRIGDKDVRRCWYKEASNYLQSTMMRLPEREGAMK